MTTILYHGGFLAADTRSTSRTHRICLDCGSSHSGSDETKKVHVYGDKNALFKGERILVMACAGSSWWCSAMYKAVEAEQDVVPLCVFMREAMKMDDVDAMIGDAIIITEDHAWVYKPTQWQPDKVFKSYPRISDDPLVLGTGADFAYMAAMEGTDPINCIRAAGKYDRHTSLLVDVVDCRGSDLAITRDDFTGDKTHYRS